MGKNQNKVCDLVLEGGGVKGIGIAGVVDKLTSENYEFRRIAGTSAGAIVGSLLAAGYTCNELQQMLRTIDYTAFRDKTLLSHLSYPGKAASLFFSDGIYKGDHLHQWLKAKLAAKGVHTFSDLRLNESWCTNVPQEERYKLVVITADVTHGKMIKLPWDCAAYGLDPDTQLVADAVRASASFPFFFCPTTLAGAKFTDGGIVSNFPIGLFDNTPEWPTIGVKLSAKPESNLERLKPITSPFGYIGNIFSTMLNAQGQMHLSDPDTVKRTIFVDTGAINSMDFDIPLEQQDFLYASGQKAAEKFLKRQ